MIKHILKLIWNKKKSNALMIVEVFLSFLVLFVVLGYVLFNLDIVKKPLGFETEDRWMIRLDNKIALQDSATLANTMLQLKNELMDHDAISDISFLDNISPFSNSTWRTQFTDQSGHNVSSSMMPVDLNYHKLMESKLIDGRLFTEDDLNAKYTAFIANKAWIDTEYDGKSMIDSIYTIGDRSYKMVGLVEENRYRGTFAEVEANAMFLRPYQENNSNILITVKSGSDMATEESIYKLVNTVSKTNGSIIETLDNLKKETSQYQWVLLIGLLAICSFLCVNVALGLFGVLWYNISKRKAEIGLRQALGAHSSDITTQFILEILILSGIAIAIGIFFAIQIPLLDVTEYPDGLFYRAIFYATLIIFMLVLLCALMPSLQASRIRPAIALHED